MDPNKRINPSLFAFTPDCRLSTGECNCTLYKPGTRLTVTGSPHGNVPTLIVEVKQQLRGLKGNQITMSYDDARKLGLDADIIWTNGYPTDVVHVNEIQ